MSLQTLFLGAMAAGLATAAAAAPVGFALDRNGSQLFRIDAVTTAPSVSATGIDIRDASGRAVRLDDIDVRTTSRAENGQLVGYSSEDRAIYRIDRDTGLATRLQSLEAGTTLRAPAATAGFDFNPSVDRARVVTTAEDNLLFIPEGDATVPAGRFFGNNETVRPLTVPAQSEFDPDVFANAYTNAVLGLGPEAFGPGALSSVQYVLDANSSSIGLLNNNGGVVTLLGGLVDQGERLRFGQIGGFDILSPAPNVNIGAALLTMSGSGVQELVLFDLIAGTPAAGDVAVRQRFALSQPFSVPALRGLALIDQPTVAPVPLPAGMALMASALAGLGLLRRRRAA